jgi:hypothetical protein
MIGEKEELAVLAVIQVQGPAEGNAMLVRSGEKVEIQVLAKQLFLIL